MKILQILPELNSGGVERGTLEVGKYLTAKGNQSVVISNGGKMAAQLEAEGSLHIALPVHKKSVSSLRQIRKLRDTILREAPDIIHVRSRVPAWITHFALKKIPAEQRPKLVSTVHGLYSVSKYSEIMTKGDAVICVSHAVKDYVLKNYPKCPREKITVIHRGVDQAQLPHGYQAPNGSDAAHLKDTLKKKFIVTLPGRITRWKGQMEFVSMISSLKEKGLPIHGLIAGGAHPKKQDFLLKIQEHISRLNLSDSITLLGDRNDLPDILSISDAVISLSRDPEAFGRVTLESLSLGVPTAGFAHGGVKEQLEQLYPAGSVRPLNMSHAEEIISSWYHKKAPAVPNSIAPFTLETMCSKTLEIYKQLLS